jgi:NAD(P)H-dependent FMN reductase
MQNDQRLEVVIIIGSTRRGRFAPTVAKWFASHAEHRQDMAIDIIDLADAGFPEVLGNHAGPRVDAVRRQLAAADAFVVVTPEYNHSFPAPLKNAFDWHSAEWHAKPVAFVSYGGRAGGRRAVEQLRQVFAELHAVTVRDTVSFHDVWTQFGSDGLPTSPVSCEAAAKSMLDQLTWWAYALREARAKWPYRF